MYIKTILVAGLLLGGYAFADSDSDIDVESYVSDSEATQNLAKSRGQQEAKDRAEALQAEKKAQRTKEAAKEKAAIAAKELALHDHQIALFRERLEYANRQIKKSETAMSETEKALTKKLAQLQAAKDLLAEANRKKDERQSSLEKLRDKNTTAQRELNSIKSSFAKTQADLRQSIAAESKAQSAHNGTVAEHQREQARLKAQQEKLRTEYQAAKNRTVETENLAKHQKQRTAAQKENLRWSQEQVNKRKNASRQPAPQTVGQQDEL